MEPFPQLKVRTEFSFRTVFGPMKRVAARLKDIGTPIAGNVDMFGGTWGHVRFEAAMRAAEIEPMFGAEFVIQRDEFRPTCWVLAEDLPALYRLTTEAAKVQVYGASTLTDEGMAAARGVIRFAGSALTDPETFDYIDLNPHSPLARRRALALSRRTGKPLVLTSENRCPSAEDQELLVALSDRGDAAPAWILTLEDFRRLLPDVPEDDFQRAVAGTWEVAERAKGLKLKQAPLIRFEGGNLREICEAGRAHRLALGHIAEWTPEYAERLEKELSLIDEKGYESYFLVVSDLVRWAKERMLVGPARGSSAGSLCCYLSGITEVDPLKHGLIFERFIDINRSDLPDIDIDFNDERRDEVFEYLAERYGRENVARVGSINTLKPASVLAQVGKRLGIAAYETTAVKNVMVIYSSGDSRYGHQLEDTLTGTAPGRDFIARHPEVKELVQLEGHAWHTGVHAAGVIVCNEPLTNFCTIGANGVAQLDKADSAALNLLKIDALGLRTLGIIEAAGVTNARELYDLKLDDQAVFDVLNEGRYSGVFQFEGTAQRMVTAQIKISSFRELDHITALARPGPLGGGASGHYIQRHAGKETVDSVHPEILKHVGSTYGVILYQEQVMSIVREVGGFSWKDTSIIRKAMSGRMGREFFDQHGAKFVKGAGERGVDPEMAKSIWDEMCNFGAWAMNKSHTVSYATISYWCAWMKRYHPLEYAAACLRKAKDDEQTIEILRELKAEGITCRAFDPERSMENWAVADGEIVGGFQNLDGIGPVKAAALVQKRAAGMLKESDYANRAVKFEKLFPAHELWGDMYENPQRYGIRPGTVIKNLADIQDAEEAVFIGQVIRRSRRDENESVRIKARGGSIWKGKSLFLDIWMVDDSLAAPVIVRVRPKLWDELGEPIADNIRDGDWMLMRVWKVPELQVYIVKKVRCLSNPGAFDGEKTRTAALG